MSENPNNNRMTPRFYLRIEEDGKIILSFKECDPWLHSVLWKAFKLKFLRGMKEKQQSFGPDDYDFLRAAVLKMLLSAQKHYQRNEEGEYILKAAGGNLMELRDTMYKMVGQIADETTI
ncbi:MAG: hypothetical protein ACTSW7_00670 [Candidatus Thorarchaeota archaeon]|nr:MAG: hypothetical protein DRQ25_15450 [Candidatus Fermentibacteria bacterium]HEC72585.1 hypothetical protein [Thermoplasmatales archaeon]